MGGVGKTPFVDHLARRLHERGYSPAILTRGYKRGTSEPAILSPGENAPVDVTGDEAQIFIRSVIAALGIGADRHAAGREIEKRFGSDVFLLDDGFQHAPLNRALDIVLIDGLDPLAGGDVFPIGRLREPWDELSRAHAIVITRGAGRNLDAITYRIRQVNSSAPVFVSDVRPVAWHGPDQLTDSHVVAFCGLANPATFWNTASDLGCKLAARLRVPDHHRYSESDLRAITKTARNAGAEAIITTEKDAVNLPPGADRMLDMPLYWLEIDVSIDREDDLLGIIGSTIPLRCSKNRKYP
jgi:tetraacyldisaccharide 4'-kinase